MKPTLRKILRFSARYGLPAILIFAGFYFGLHGFRAAQATRDGDAWARAKLAEAVKPWQAAFGDEWEAICRSPLVLNNPKK